MTENKKLSATEQVILYYKPVGYENFDNLKKYVKSIYLYANEVVEDEYVKEKWEYIDNLKNEPGEFLGMLRGLHPNYIKPLGELILEHDPSLFVNIMFRWDSLVFGDNLNPFKEIFNYYGVYKKD